ncbi:hypothetical protein AAG570_002597 [Ranatra chinensis]|uniref:Programmed cell death protein 2 C-terminal domain-containing protein n=1 Tax=Ranatra chinensis TaxID=642074 RepID=A0ABD0Y832_9HEMI
MSRIGNRVLLGYEDELITEKYRSQVDFTTNKIGGKPDWPGDAPTAVNCKLCGLNIPLVLQIYAPLENSQYHRTLYIFACINPNCWNQIGSWVCLRSQILADMDGSGNWTGDTNTSAANMVSTDWCTGSDTWGDEENGNLVDEAGRRGSEGGEDLWNRRQGGECGLWAGPQSTEQQLAASLSSMVLSNDSNANSGRHQTQGEGAAGIAAATAVIEADEGEVVSIDTPTLPQVDIVALIEGVAPLPQVPISDLEFIASFISVAEEELSSTISPTSVDHVKEVIREYQTSTGSTTGGEEDVSLPNSAAGGGAEPEKYEKSLPAHGDKLFHQFLIRVQSNPGQIFRFFRYGGRPLFLYPVQHQELPRLCCHCGGEVVFEAQVLPTLIPKLRLGGSTQQKNCYHLEFGSIFLYTCQASCWREHDTCREEPLLVQMEKM